jgi:hypothetical protein
VQGDRVTGTQEPDEAQARLDERRRRLYRVGATEEDLRRYAEHRDAVLERVPPAAVAPLRRHRRGLLVGATGAVLLVALIGVAAAVQTSPPSPRSSPARATTSVVQDIGDGQVLGAQDPVLGPVSTATTVDGTAAVGQHYTGTGAAVVPLDISAASFQGGRVLVSLAAAGHSPIAWRALHLTTRNDWSTSVQVVARSTPAGRDHVPFPSVFAYRAGPPSRIVVDAEPDVRWTLLVAFASRSTPALR